MEGPDDTDLARRAADGNREALETLLRRHQPRVYSLCRRMTGNDADALDATQEALIAIARGLPRFDGRAKFTTWMHRVATNACLDEMRRRSRRPEPVDHDSELASTGVDPAESVTDRLSIDEALAGLSEDHRAAVVLRDQLGLDYDEIAEVLGVRIGTVKSRIARGRAQLAARLGNSAVTGDVQGPER